MKIKKIVIALALVAALSAMVLCGCAEEREESPTQTATETVTE